MSPSLCLFTFFFFGAPVQPFVFVSAAFLHTLAFVHAKKRKICETKDEGNLRYKKKKKNDSCKDGGKKKTLPFHHPPPPPSASLLFFLPFRSFSPSRARRAAVLPPPFPLGPGGKPLPLESRDATPPPRLLIRRQEKTGDGVGAFVATCGKEPLHEDGIINRSFEKRKRKKRR